MAGRKQFDVDAALDAAMRRFWADGFAGTSVDDLGRATGLGRGSLYGTFGDKDALFRRALERYSALWQPRYDEALAAHPDDPVAAVGAYLGVVIDRIEDPTVPDGCLVVQSAAQSTTLSPAARDAVSGAVDAQRRRLRAALGAGAPTTDPTRLDELALFVVGVQQAVVVMSRAGASHADLRALARTGTDAVAAALRGELRPGPPGVGSSR